MQEQKIRCNEHKNDTSDINQKQHHESLFEKYRKGSHSGYLDDQYETTKEFPQISEVHFRIEDDQTIIDLQNLYRNSKPVDNSYKKASTQFNNRMQNLLHALDHQPVYSTFNQPGPSAENQTRIYYCINEDYDDQKALAQAYQRVQQQILEQKVHQLSLYDSEPTFIRSKLNNKFKHSNAIDSEARQIKNKFARLSIQENQL